MRPKAMRIELIHREFMIKWEEVEVKSEEVHWHDLYELELFTEGKGSEIVCGKNFDIKRGCMQLLRMSDYHEIKIEEKAKAIRFYIPERCLPEKTVRSIRRNKAVIITYLTEEVTASIEAMYKLLDGCPKENASEHVVYAKEAFINMIMMGFLWSRNLQPADQVPKDENRVLDIQSYIYQHLREPLTLDDIAKAFNLNHQYINRIFSKHAGMGVYAYLKKCRTTYAADLALKTKLSSKEIFEKTGYSSYSNFLRDFKTAYGESPLQYRKRAPEFEREVEEKYQEYLVEYKKIKEEIRRREQEKESAEK